MNKNSETITDIDGNVYHTVTIGEQVWLVENLKTTKYNDGTDIPYIVDAAEVWYGLNAPGYCWHNDDISNKNTVGALYNFYALNTGKLAPKGWHIPTDDEWTVLAEFLGGSSIAGGKMKEVGTEHWLEPNTGATNSSGFSALLAGFRGKSGFIPLSVGYTLFWSSTAFDELDGLPRYLLFDKEELGRNNGGKYHGFAVRCLKD
ncbi:MAG: fibrobacter succinogenes major paralogous domain-containing protein [Ferruginibacter sp.]